MLYLQARVGGRQIRWPIPPGIHILGRGRSCEISVEDAAISRRHLKITVDGEDVLVEDLNSANGLWIDSKKVSSGRLAAGRTFSAGSLLFSIRQGVSLASSPGTPGPPAETDPGASMTRPIAADSRGGDQATPLPGTISAISRSHPDGAASRVPAEPAHIGLLRSLLEENESPDGRLGALLGGAIALCGCEGGLVLGHREAGWYLAVARGVLLPGGLTPEAIAAMSARASSVTRGGSRGLPDGAPATRVSIVEIASVPVLQYPLLLDGTLRGLILLHPLRSRSRLDGLEMIAENIARVLSGQMAGEGSHHDLRAVETHTAERPFLTASEQGRKLLAEVERLAQTDLPVLLLGESGTGKELLAHMIHDRSPRASGPFVALNCSAFPADLVEAELFGIQKGVATGVAERTGRFLQASDGTLFLDEIGDLPLGLQPKLLRALESGEILPVGAPAPIPVDVRVVSASHKDLRQAVSAGVFREDLLFRLAGAEVGVPPLRSRPEDILPLAKHFARIAAESIGTRFEGIEMEAAALLMGYSWPGNARELRHMLARAVALADGPILHTGLLPAIIKAEADVPMGEALLGLNENWKVASEKFARLYFRQLIERCGGNLSEAARQAGLGRSTLYAKLQELGVKTRRNGD